MEPTRKIVINVCYGGFSISRKAFLELREMGCQQALEEVDWGEKYSDGLIRKDNWESFGDRIPRDDPMLVGVVEKLGKEANGQFSSLKVVEVPIDVEWEIEEYDGMEHIAQSHRTWS